MYFYKLYLVTLYASQFSVDMTKHLDQILAMFHYSFYKCDRQSVNELRIIYKINVRATNDKMKLRLLFYK